MELQERCCHYFHKKHITNKIGDWDRYLDLLFTTLFASSEKDFGPWSPSGPA